MWSSPTTCCPTFSQGALCLWLSWPPGGPWRQRCRWPSPWQRATSRRLGIRLPRFSTSHPRARISSASTAPWSGRGAGSRSTASRPVPSCKRQGRSCGCTRRSARHPNAGPAALRPPRRRPWHSATAAVDSPLALACVQATAEHRDSDRLLPPIFRAGIVRDIRKIPGGLSRTGLSRAGLSRTGRSRSRVRRRARPTRSVCRRAQVATTCLFLASKVEETPKKLKDVLLEAFKVQHRTVAPPEPDSQELWRLKEQVRSPS